MTAPSQPNSSELIGNFASEGELWRNHDRQGAKVGAQLLLHFYVIAKIPFCLYMQSMNSITKHISGSDMD